VIGLYKNLFQFDSFYPAIIQSFDNNLKDIKRVHKPNIDYSSNMHHQEITTIPCKTLFPLMLIELTFGDNYENFQGSFGRNLLDCGLTHCNNVVDMNFLPASQGSQRYMQIYPWAEIYSGRRVQRQHFKRNNDL